MSIIDDLTRARIQLLLDKTFYGNLCLSLKLVEDNSIGTFATDGKNILYDSEFAGNLSNIEKQWVLCHEILHIVLKHLTRRNDREQVRWNYAIDFAVNSILNKEFKFVPEGAVYNQKFEDKTAEMIYNELGKEQQKDNEQKNGKGKGQKGNGKETITVDGEQIKVKQYDEHKDIKGSKAEIDEFEKDWKIKTIKSYEQSKIAGKEPAGMKIFIDGLLQPKLDWRTMMKQFIVSTSKSDFQWSPPNRRLIHRGLYLPSLTGESLGDIVVIVDNSGSTAEYQKRFFSECNALLQQYDMNLHLIVVDTEIKSYKVYQKGDSIDLEYKGGGGTDLRVGFNHIKENMINPSVVVCLTDGYSPLPEIEENPTLWVITKDGIDLEDVPFGEKVIIDE